MDIFTKPSFFFLFSLLSSLFWVEIGILFSLLYFFSLFSHTCRKAFFFFWLRSVFPTVVGLRLKAFCGDFPLLHTDEATTNGHRPLSLLSLLSISPFFFLFLFFFSCLPYGVFVFVLGWVFNITEFFYYYFNVV